MAVVGLMLLAVASVGGVSPHAATPSLILLGLTPLETGASRHHQFLP